MSVQSNDGQSAFRTLESLVATANTEAILATAQVEFDDAEFSAGNLMRLREEMHRELVAVGLYADEATVMLSTWESAYFRSAGLRLFFLVPRQWTDHYLPLAITRDGRALDTHLERVMVGRIELISATQQALLDRLAHMAVSDGEWVEAIPESAARDAFLAGRSDFGDIGVSIPPDYQTYLALGRFRNALVVAEERARPTPSLTQFIDTYALHPYRWTRDKSEPAVQEPAPPEFR